MGQSFIANHLSTIGADFSVDEVNIDEDIVELQIWDIAGEADLDRIRKLFFDGAKGSFCVFDLTNSESFENLPRWINHLNKNNREGIVPLMILGNKVDLKDERVVSEKDINKYIKRLNKSHEYDVIYFETSAKTGENVDEAFSTFAKQLKEISDSS